MRVLALLLLLCVGCCCASKPASEHGLCFFLGIGVQKGGSNFVWNLLNGLSFLQPAQQKELHAFDAPTPPTLAKYLRNWCADDDDDDDDEKSKLACLRALLDSAPPCRHLFEFTPKYIFRAETPRRIAALLGERHRVRFVLLLREPVKRAISNVGQNFKLQPELNTAETVERLLRVEHAARFAGAEHDSRSLTTYLQRGMYAEQLQRYLDAGFAPAQFLVLFTCQLRNASFVAHSVAAFLNRSLTDADWQLVRSPDRQTPTNHRSVAADLSPDLRRQLHDAFRPSVHRLLDLLVDQRFDFDRRAFDEEFAVYRTLDARLHAHR